MLYSGKLCTWELLRTYVMPRRRSWIKFLVYADSSRFCLFQCFNSRRRSLTWTSLTNYMFLVVCIMLRVDDILAVVVIMPFWLIVIAVVSVVALLIPVLIHIQLCSWVEYIESSAFMLFKLNGYAVLSLVWFWFQSCICISCQCFSSSSILQRASIYCCPYNVTDYGAALAKLWIILWFANTWICCICGVNVRGFITQNLFLQSSWTQYALYLLVLWESIFERLFAVNADLPLYIHC